MNKIIWITGAGSGIGQAVAVAFAKSGATVILSGRNIEKLDETKELCEKHGAETFVLPLDVTNSEAIPKAVSEVIRRFGKIDVLINNAGVSQRANALDITEEVGRKLMEVNFFGAVHLTRLVGIEMKKAGAGNIAVISSVVGKFGFPLRSYYAAAKHALDGYFESLMLELHKTGVYITIVSPGRIRTEISQNALTQDGTAHQTLDPGQANGISVDICAAKIKKAIDRNVPEVYIGKGEVAMIYIKRYFPWLFRKMAVRVNAK